MMKSKRFEITLSADGRLDKALAASSREAEDLASEGLSRARLQQLIKSGCACLNGDVVQDANYPAKRGDVITLDIPEPVPSVPEAETIALDVVFEDNDLLVINKPPGLVVHPAAGNWEHTMVNALLAHCGDSLSGIGGVARPGIVHRLDKDTSGLMVVAKNDMAHQGLTAQFSDRTLSRIYQALVWGIPNPVEGQIEGAIGRHPKSRQKMAVVAHGGKEALTYYETLDIYGLYASLVECRLATGRTHQIRVHMAHCGHAVVGDPLYGSRRRLGGKDKGLVALLQDFPRQALHAGEIKFVHPRTGKSMKFKASLPEDMAALIKKVKKKALE